MNIEKLAQKLVTNAISSKMMISTAESCTGGMVASAITAIPGSSEIFGYGFVTYSNQAKRELINVQESTLNQYGAVSEETAIEMAQGALYKSGADIAASVTGIAGPGGATEHKPVGLVYIAIATKNNIICKKLNLSGSRDEVRKQTTEECLRLLMTKIVD